MLSSGAGGAAVVEVVSVDDVGCGVVGVVVVGDVVTVGSVATGADIPVCVPGSVFAFEPGPPLDAAHPATAATTSAARASGMTRRRQSDATLRTITSMATAILASRP